MMGDAGGGVGEAGGDGGRDEVPGLRGCSRPLPFPLPLLEGSSGPAEDRLSTSSTSISTTSSVSPTLVSTARESKHL